jgi:hypothetical protein
MPKINLLRHTKIVFLIDFAKFIFLKKQLLGQFGQATIA